MLVGVGAMTVWQLAGGVIGVMVQGGGVDSPKKRELGVHDESTAVVGEPAAKRHQGPRPRLMVFVQEPEQMEAPEPQQVESEPRVSLPELCDPRPIEEVYELGRPLGSGKFAHVLIANEKQADTVNEVAVKVIARRGRNDLIENEIRIATDLARHGDMQHCNIVHFHRVFAEFPPSDIPGEILPSQINIVMEKCEGGSLGQRWDARKKTIFGDDQNHETCARVGQKLVFSEQEVALIMRQLLEASKYLHQRENDENPIIHRDITLDNVIFQKGDVSDYSSLKLADFGLARYCKKKHITNDIDGSVRYIAPEAWEGVDTAKRDIWSLGVIMCALFWGAFPFDQEFRLAQESIVKNSQPYDGKLNILQRGSSSMEDQVFAEPEPEDTLAKISLPAKEVIEAMLQKDPDKRDSAAKLLEYPFFKTHGFSTAKATEQP